MLYAALAVCPVCAAHPGKQGKINIVRECGGEGKGSTEIKEKIETWREQRTGTRRCKKLDAGQHSKEIKKIRKTERKGINSGDSNHIKFKKHS